MVLAETKEGNFYICQSELWEDFSCGFIFPEGLSNEEIKKMALEKIDFLKKQKE